MIVKEIVKNTVDTSNNKDTEICQLLKVVVAMSNNDGTRENIKEIEKLLRKVEKIIENKREKE